MGTPMSEAPLKRLIFEGWRFIPHSSAIVLQSYCLAAARRPGLEIKVRELPFNGPWSRIGGMFPEALDRMATFGGGGGGGRNGSGRCCRAHRLAC